MQELIPIVAAAFVAMLVSMFWYSPACLGNQWMKAVKLTKKDLDKAKKKGMGKEMTLSFIATLLTAYVLDRLAAMIGYATFGEGAILGFLAWVGFTAPSLLNPVLWEMRPASLFYINSMHSLVTLLLVGGIVASF